jgi:protein-L-isoaspartate(D-aspartate) O-methyltransferase
LQDAPLPIGYHETISAPHMHATCLELLREHLRPGARVLDVGSGSGYLAAAMGVMVGDEGKVIGVEKHAELAQLSIVNVRRDHPELLDKGVVEVRCWWQF